ncbi:MAG: DUF5716 family protein [Lachnospiraceae bacterium]|nr:DUF5716 family protein [Lachnospiraceae bacterium]
MITREIISGIATSTSRPGSGPVIGIDLGDEFSLVGYVYSGEEEPQTASELPGEEHYAIPTVIGKKKGENLWSFGTAAVNAKKSGEGECVGNLLTRAKEGNATPVDGRDYDPTDLLSLFLKKCIGLLAVTAPVEKVEAFVITVADASAETLEVLRNAVATLRIKPEKVYYQSYSESAYQYMLRQPQELFVHDVLILSLDKNGVFARTLRKNTHTTPVVVLMEEHLFENLKEDNFVAMPEGKKARMDQELYQILFKLMDGKYISAIYLIGDGFDGDWYPDSVKYMVRRSARVFRGNNLFVKGACYGAKEKLGFVKDGPRTVFLGKDKVKANVGMRAVKEGEEAYLALLDAGGNWYETARETDLILDRVDTLDFVITPLDGKNTWTAQIFLTGMPLRPAKATRVHLEMRMRSERKLYIKVTDLGFGEFFPATNEEWEAEVILDS